MIPFGTTDFCTNVTIAFIVMGLLAGYAMNRAAKAVAGNETARKFGKGLVIGFLQEIFKK
jgi:F0F1-type ATP synthase membrane subunit c/vacuolar-type H+-ATPase subunit K